MLRLDTSVSTKPWIYYDAITYGPTSAPIAKASNRNGYCAPATSPRATAPVCCFNLSRFAALLKNTPKPSESLSYVPITIIMNLLSLADAKAHPLPNGQVVGWFLNPTQLLFGDPSAWSLKPDMVAYLVPRKTAEDYLASLQSKTTLPDRSPPSLGPNDLCLRQSSRSARPGSPNSSNVSKPFVAIGPTSSQWLPYPPS
jgi:hypothetical protein